MPDGHLPIANRFTRLLRRECGVLFETCVKNAPKSPNIRSRPLKLTPGSRIKIGFPSSDAKMPINFGSKESFIADHRFESEGN